MLDRFRRSKNAGLVGIVSLLSVLVGVGIGSAIQHFDPISQTVHAANYLPQTQSLPDFVSLVKKVGPAVVNISTTQVRKSAESVPSPFGDQDPFNDFSRRFFGGRMPRGSQRQRGLGSGFIIDRDGTILTNYHVVDGAQKIVVTLSDGRSFDAKVLGRDQKTDIAIVKINSPQDLPVVTLGDSDRLDVGEWVLAIGDPFGLDHTVTSGIVSAKGRQIGAGPYDSFIQTDASINPGNSGGPLLNMRGEVVGINTAIFSQSGGNIGIGFAIPTNLVRGILPQLKNKGKVVRGYLGTVIQRITPELADSLGLKSPHGALVAETTKDGPAARAGIRAGDVIVEFNGKEIKDSADLPLQVSSVTPGTAVQVKILRDSKEVTLPITVGEMKENEVVASTEEQGGFGLAVQTVTPEVADNLGLGRAEGVVVTSIKPGSPADEAGLQRGDVIAQVNRHPVRNVADYNREMGNAGKEKTLLLLVKRGDGSLFLALKR
jgi:serine protease Do